MRQLEVENQLRDVVSRIIVQVELVTLPPTFIQF